MVLNNIVYIIPSPAEMVLQQLYFLLIMLNYYVIDDLNPQTVGPVYGRCDLQFLIMSGLILQVSR